MEIGSKIIDGRYAILEKLGQGAFGAVYRAHDLVSDVDVGIKTIPDEVSRDETELTDFRKNFRLVHSLHHPNIAAPLTLEFDKVSEKYLLVMEFVDGIGLAKFRKAQPGRKVPVEKAVNICRQIADALDYAHKKSVLHRDIKPENVHVTAKGDVKLLDFGLASEIRSTVLKLSRTVGALAIAGTRPYMAPEQFEGKPPGPGVDHYALGVLFYELVSKELPFQSDDVQVLMNAVCNVAPTPLEELTKAQNVILLKMLAKDPTQRFQSAGAFLSALKATLEGKLLSDYRRSFDGDKLDVKRALEICSSLSDTLDKERIAGKVGREINPEYVLVSQDRDVRFLDFWEDDFKDVPDHAGSRFYKAPEQLREKRQTPESSIYSLGVIFYELVSSRLPFDSPDIQTLTEQVCNKNPELVSELNKAQNQIVQKALAKAPAKRFQNAGAFVSALKKTLAPPSKTPKIMAALTGLALAGGVGWYFLAPPPMKPLTPAERVAEDLFQQMLSKGTPIFRNGIGLVPSFQGCSPLVYKQATTALIRSSNKKGWDILVRKDLQALVNDQGMVNKFKTGKIGQSRIKLNEIQESQMVVLGECEKDELHLMVIDTNSVALAAASGSLVDLGKTERLAAEQREKEEALRRQQELLATQSRKAKEEANRLAEAERKKKAQDALLKEQALLAESKRKREAEEARLANLAQQSPIISNTMEFVRVSGGTFKMGCGSWQSDCYDDEKPVQTVRVGSFDIGKYEVTQGQWRAIMGSNPSKFGSCGNNCPVENVSWDDVQKFIKKLNAKGQGRYRLPTEAEWEYACRSGGKPEKYCGGNDVGRVAWYAGNSGDKTHPVGQKSRNGLGLYDMSGNVYEWTCSDWGGYGDGKKNHAKCSVGGSYRVHRGGGWRFKPADVRSANRIRFDPGYRGNYLGVRLARTLP